MHLYINELNEKHFGDYFCHAENVYGASTRLVSLKQDQFYRNVTNVIDCCIDEGVSSYCMKACGYFLDIDVVKDRSECLIDLDKLMKCASDNTDHTICCKKSNVPVHCMNWCTGDVYNLTEQNSCALEYATNIIDCYQSNRNHLKNAPLNLHFRQNGIGSALIMWTFLNRSNDKIDGYRIYWQSMNDNQTDFHQMNSRKMNVGDINVFYADTKESQIEIFGLQPNILYMFTVKAANKFGEHLSLLCV